MMGNGDTVDDHLCSVQFLSMIALWLNYKEGLDSNLLNNIVSRYVPYVFRLPQGQLLALQSSNVQGKHNPF